MNATIATGGDFHDEHGTGLIGTIAGVIVFLAFLLLAVQVTVNLFAHSAVTAATYDAARIVAGGDVVEAVSEVDLRNAEAHARAVLGRVGEQAEFDWTLTDARLAGGRGAGAPCPATRARPLRRARHGDAHRARAPGGPAVTEPGRRPESRSSRFSSESGQVAGMEAVPFGVLVFVARILLVASAWGVVDAKAAVTAAAREGTRAYVEAPTLPVALATAEQASRRALDGHGRSGDAANVEIDAAGLRRCAPVTVTVRTTVPVVRVPWLGAVGGTLQVTGRHTEVIDPYRSGELERGRCD